MQQRIINGDELTPVAIFHRLQGERKVLLESRAEGKHGRYSIIAANPVETIRVDGNDVTDATGTVYADDYAFMTQTWYRNMKKRCLNYLHLGFA